MSYSNILSSDTPVYAASIVDTLNPFTSYGKYTDKAQGKTAWDCNDWVNFHKVLVTDKGKQQADSTWVNYWLMGLDQAAGGKGDADAGSGWVVDTVPIDCRTFDNNFSTYIKKSGNEALASAVFSGIGGKIGELESGTVTIGENIGGGITGISGAIGGAGKALKYVVPGLIIVGGILISLWAYKKYVKTN